MKTHSLQTNLYISPQDLRPLMVVCLEIQLKRKARKAYDLYSNSKKTRAYASQFPAHTTSLQTDHSHVRD